MGTTQHPSQQRLARSGEHGNDLLGATAAGLGAAIAILPGISSIG